MRCSMSQKLDCKARAIQRLDTGHVFTTNDHNHPADMEEADIMEFLDQLKLVCQSGVNMPLKDIYAQVAEWYEHQTVASEGLNIQAEDLLRKIKKKPNMPRYIVNGFVFHVNIMKGEPRKIYLRCLEYKRLGCRARALIPSDGSARDIKVNSPHNHPPDTAAEDKMMFFRDLKDVALKNPSIPGRTIYGTLAEMYPNAAREIPFEAIRHKITRWRKVKE